LKLPLVQGNILKSGHLDSVLIQANDIQGHIMWCSVVTRGGAHAPREIRVVAETLEQRR
jgi:hypothetical protein